MKDKEFERELKKARVESRRNVNNAKGRIKKVIDDTEYAIIIQTDKHSVLIGNKYDTCQLLCNLFNNLLRQEALTKEEIINLLNMVCEEEQENSNEEKLDKLSSLLDKAIRLQELQNKNKDED